MKGMNGFKAAQTLLAEQHQHTAILVLTAYGQAAYIEAMLNIGVKGYWLKSASSREIRQAVHDIAEGKDSFDPEIRQILADEKATSHPLKPLTNREQEVLQLVVQELRNAEISERLHISLKTVETHITSLYNKLGIQSRTEAITFAQKQGLLFEERS
jgi:DNA-binding NarL/FixJ family response regulator